ncbi:hypothetical protein AAHE18_14G189500 [Arachis hypogaea]
MLVLCVSIRMVASVGVLCNKKQNAKEAKKVQNIEGSSPSVTNFKVCSQEYFGASSSKHQAEEACAIT